VMAAWERHSLKPGILQFDQKMMGGIIEMLVNLLKSKVMKSVGAFIVAGAFILMLPLTANAHCDTMDGPTVADGIKAMESNNINYVLKWVQPKYEQELTDKFNLSMQVKDLNPEAKELSEQYFFSELVRMHRAGEGAPFDGLKPHGTPIDEKVLAADQSLVVGNLSPMAGLMEDDKMPELTKRFDHAMALKNYDINDVAAGREYIEAYVQFFKFAEGEEEHGALGVVDAHGAETVHADEDEVTYSVKAGDTLSEIAWQYHTTYQAIAELNNLANPHLIFPGQKLVIPAK